MFFYDQTVEQPESFLSFQPSQPLVSTGSIPVARASNPGKVPNILMARLVPPYGASPLVGMTGMA